MATQLRLKLAFSLVCLLLCSLAPHCVSGSVASQNDGTIDAFSAGGRHLQQMLTPCPHNWAFDNFTNLENACPYSGNNISVNYPTQPCCAALAIMICPYKALFDDSTSACATDFFTTWSEVEPTYPNNFFGIICTDVNQPNGLPCPGNTTSKASPSQGSYSLVPTILLAVAVLEVLVLFC